MEVKCDLNNLKLGFIYEIWTDLPRHDVLDINDTISTEHIVSSTTTLRNVDALKLPAFLSQKWACDILFAAEIEELIEMRQRSLVRAKLLPRTRLILD